jgi:hypothetical protein
MQLQQVLHVPRCTILEQVSGQSALPIHRYGSATNADGLIKGCVEIDVPPIPGRSLEGRRAFYGEFRGDLDSAQDSAAEVALRHLCDEYRIAVDDWNYWALVEHRQRLAVGLESRRQTEVKIGAARKEATMYKQAYDELVQRMKDICLRFSGLLPVRAGGGPSGIEYAGPPSPPAGGFDRLALELVQIIQSAYGELPAALGVVSSLVSSL